MSEHSFSFAKSDDGIDSQRAQREVSARKVGQPCWQCPGAKPSIPPTRHLCQHGEVQDATPKGLLRTRQVVLSIDVSHIKPFGPGP
jgi:hypothetical protein